MREQLDSTTSDERTRAVAQTLNLVRDELADGLSEATLLSARDRLIELTERKALFPRSHFPLPVGAATERTFRLSEDDYGLYVNSGIVGQTAPPHDHGSAWAIIVGIFGKERHRLYRRVDDFSEAGRAELEVVAEVDVESGAGVVMMPGDIHSIHALEPEPLLHLHLYGAAFRHQSTRKEFNLHERTYRAFDIEDFGFVEAPCE